jgi:FolB domain-containing protein
MTLENQHARITLQQLELTAFLGWPDAERAEAQPISIDIQIEFEKPPAACTTDQLQDTYCYATLVGAIREKVAAKKYRLLEHLGYEIYQTIKQSVTAAKIGVHVTKQPPIPNLTGGVAFYFGD